MLIFYKVLMALAAVFCVITLANTQNKLLRIAGVLLAIGVAWAIIDNPYLGNSYLLYYMGMALFLVYAAITGGISVEKRSILLLIAVCVFAHGLFVINHWPFAYEIKLLQFLPVILYFAFVIRKRREYKPELGPLTIFAADALIQAISYIRLMSENNN